MSTTVIATVTVLEVAPGAVPLGHPLLPAVRAAAAEVLLRGEAAPARLDEE